MSTTHHRDTAAGPARGPRGPRDGRSSRGSRGFEIVLIAAYGIFAISATARSGVQIGLHFSYAPVAYSLSLLAALTYIAVMVALIRGGARSRLAQRLCVVELVGVLVVGTLTLVDPALFPDATVWSVYGQGYGYVPLVLPVIALVFMGITARRGPVSRVTAS